MLNRWCRGNQLTLWRQIKLDSYLIPYMGREQDGLKAYLGDVNYKVKEENGTHGLGRTF